ncbi:MAG: S1C family serine protease [Planctomycetia bacterium]|nr:S1C family serine protease [Planctomycetia bacterium]
MFGYLLFLAFALAPDETPFLVRLETTGGMEKVGEHFAIRTLTGVVLSEDGWVVTSAAGLAHRPDAILARLSDGTHCPAEQAGTDFARNLTLLRLRLPEGKKLVPAMAAPVEGIAVGRPVQTLGRGLDADTVLVTYGVLSATGRIRGLAIQTDAHVSAGNYGGLLTDTNRRALGVLTPFGMENESPLSGTELYDSGVGFAIPFADVLEIFPKLQEGDRKPFPKLGVIFDHPNPMLSGTQILHVAKETPAEKIGLRKGDRILEVDGLPVTRGYDVLKILARRVEGEQVRFGVERDGKRVDLAW